MKNRISIFILVLVLFSAGILSAQTVVSNFRFTATASVSGKLTFDVVLSNVAVPGTLDFGVVALSDTPKVATNTATGGYSYAYIVYDVTYAADWRIKCYTDNEAAGAIPRYVGPQDGLYGEKNDGSGLVRVDGTGTNNGSTYIKVYSDAKNPDNTYAKAPCTIWSGTHVLNNGIPNPAYQGGETSLYWVNQDLDGNGTNVNALTPVTHGGWTEALNGGGYTHAAIDANGDGDMTDTIDNLGKVFEYAPWMPVVSDNDDPLFSDANTAELMNSAIGCGMTTSGAIKAYFAITDDVGGGSFQTDQLYFEMYVE